MANFLNQPGTNGLIQAAFNLVTSEMNALSNGSAASSTVGGTSGVFTQTNWSSAIWKRTEGCAITA